MKKKIVGTGRGDCGQHYAEYEDGTRATAIDLSDALMLVAQMGNSLGREEKPRYGITEGRFFMEDNKPMIHVKYRNLDTKEDVALTIEAKTIRVGLSLEANDFIAGVIEEIEKFRR